MNLRGKWWVLDGTGLCVPFSSEEEARKKAQEWTERTGASQLVLAATSLFTRTEKVTYSVYEEPIK